jgi:small-conductance mechanosensitive channel
MAVDVLTIAAPAQALLSTPVPEGASFEERWTAWQTRGAAHDRAVRRKMAVAAPILIAVAAVVFYLLLGR